MIICVYVSASIDFDPLTYPWIVKKRGAEGTRLFSGIGFGIQGASLCSFTSTRNLNWFLLGFYDTYPDGLPFPNGQLARATLSMKLGYCQ